MLQGFAQFALRSCSSLNNRTFSMAMTAWSAKIFEQRDLFVCERPDLRPTNQNRPDGTPSRSSGVASTCERPDF